MQQVLRCICFDVLESVRSTLRIPILQHMPDELNRGRLDKLPPMTSKVWQKASCRGFKVCCANLLQ